MWPRVPLLSAVFVGHHFLHFLLHFRVFSKWTTTAVWESSNGACCTCSITSSSTFSPASCVARTSYVACMYSYICEILVRFRSYLFLRAPFAQTPKRSTEEGRPGSAVVDVWARFVQCVALGVRSFFFFSVEVDNIRRFPGFFL